MTDDLSRRELFSELRHSVAKNAVASVALARPVRPPHAIEETDFLMACDSCGECVDACPHASIFVLKTENIADGTPVLAPDERACHLCEGMPCVVACPTDALTFEQPFQPFGYVTVDPTTCITFFGPECGACSVCPGDVSAIRFKRNRPSIDEDACVGCGLCIEACPTTPVSIRFHKPERKPIVEQEP